MKRNFWSLFFFSWVFVFIFILLIKLKSLIFKITDTNTGSLVQLSQQQAISCNVGTSAAPTTPTPGCVTKCQVKNQIFIKYFILLIKINLKTETAFTTGTAGTTTYGCANSVTCPTNTVDNLGTGSAFSCCSTADCNTAPLTITSISCYTGVGTAATTMTGCYTLCQVKKIK